MKLSSVSWATNRWSWKITRNWNGFNILSSWYYLAWISWGSYVKFNVMRDTFWWKNQKLLTFWECNKNYLLQTYFYLCLSWPSAILTAGRKGSASMVIVKWVHFREDRKDEQEKRSGCGLNSNTNFYSCDFYKRLSSYSDISDSQMALKLKILMLF